MSRIIVVGGGPAGMMAAVAAAGAGSSVVLIEKNEKLGKKLFITGKGRCNVTNAADMDALFANICTNGKFLYSAFYGFNNTDVMNFLEQAGCRLKTERGDRVFPASDHSSDVIAALQRELKRRGVEVLLNTKAADILMKVQEEESAAEAQGAGEPQRMNSHPHGEQDRKPVFGGVALSDGKTIRGDACIICTGGMAYPATGSTGDGYRFAEKAGHSLVEPRPALVPLRVKEAWCGQLMGLSLKNVSLTLVCRGRKVYEGFGEMLFTHFGVSGPLVLTASSYYKKGGGELFIDLKPALDEEQLDKRLLRDFEENRNRQFKNALGALFPGKLVPVMVSLSGICPEKKVNEITREERRGFAKLIKSLPLTVTGTGGFEEAVITGGGVSVKDINPSTMESRKVTGLYFAGEVLDLDGLTGGFNLQIAWSTGHLAGQSAAKLQ
ncbi:MAG: NAD(P)/FAD-dependent oxidoreductase [Butyrivibrio sp.]|nr:NAD(P)/FAD-dependent oxidoreductase [Acetatifactor muris]MCM1560494.1 NAD(P)/FAD-dependent oxidoreductase [Butyrivibrio sp.]